MKTLWPLYRRELGAYFKTPAAYTLCVAYLLLAGYFFAQPLFLINQASIRSFLELSPLLLTFFMPAITMRHLAEEFKTGTIELLLTSPAEDWEILLSKFLASLTLLASTLALTLAYPLTVGFLGRLDWGAVAGAYAGLLLTGALLAAAGIFASSLTRNQIVAFIIGFMIGFALFLMGKVNEFVPLWLTPITDFLGFDSHLDNISRGVLDTRDLLYYLSGTGVFLFLTQVQLWLMKSKRWISSTTGVALVCAIVALANTASQYAYLRLDLSRGSIYSISDASKRILRELPDPVVIRVYHSKELPPQIMVTLRYLKDLLKEYASGSRGKVKTRFIEVGDSPQTRDEALQDGLSPVRFDIIARDKYEQREGILGLTLNYQDKKDVIAYLQDTGGLEYDLTSRIKALAASQKPVLGFVKGRQAMTREALDPALQERMAARYDLRDVDLAKISVDSAVPSEVQSLFLLGPQEKFSEQELFLLDQYLLSGRALCVALDTKNTDMRAFSASDLDTGLGPWLKHHGLEPRSTLVFDAQSQPIQLAMRQGAFMISNIVQYPPMVIATQLNAKHPVTSRLDSLLMPFVSPIAVSTASASGSVERLAESSPYSWAKRPIAATYLGLHPFQFPKYEQGDLKGPFALAAARVANFEPYWKELPKSVKSKSPLTQAAKPGRLVVLGTSKMFGSDFRSANSNSVLFLNLADWLSQDTDLIAVRSKSTRFYALREVPAMAKQMIRYANMFLPPAAAVLAGLLMWRLKSKRRNRARQEYGQGRSVPEQAPS